MAAGCALGIANTDDIEKVTMNNLAIFSVQEKCVLQKDTAFDIPARMPPCTSPTGKCICAFFWQPNNGTGNYVMTGFDCSVTGSPSDATAIAPPKPPTWCDRNDPKCVTQAGSKQPIYAFNTPSNVPWKGNYDRPGYRENWSFKNGAQNDIFLPKNVKATPKATSSMKASVSPAKSSSLAKTSSSPSKAATSKAASTNAAKVSTTTAKITSSTKKTSTTAVAKPAPTSNKTIITTSKPKSSSKGAAQTTSSKAPAKTKRAEAEIVEPFRRRTVVVKANDAVVPGPGYQVDGLNADSLFVYRPDEE